MAEGMFKEIKGKTRGRYGFAMIATREIKKGTFIMQEKPQLVWKNPTGVPQNMSESDKELGIAEIKGIHAAFHDMKKSDQDEYLQLWNLYEFLDLTKPVDKWKLENLKNCISLCFPDYTKNGLILAMKIHGIYKSNSSHDDTFVNIKTAKFNHSCNANAIRIVMHSISRNFLLTNFEFILLISNWEFYVWLGGLSGQSTLKNLHKLTKKEKKNIV